VYWWELKLITHLPSNVEMMIAHSLRPVRLHGAGRKCNVVVFTQTTSQGSQFKWLPQHRLLRLRFLEIFLSHSRQILEEYIKLGYYLFLLNAFHFTSHLAFRHSVIRYADSAVK
jgi:hypothetical protein